MHNGTRVVAGSYFGLFGSHLLTATRGIHEPQEEFAFGRVIEQLRPGSTMVELGAYWGYYSLWFSKVVPNARCLLLEPDCRNLRMGERNFQANGVEGKFFNYAVGAVSGCFPGEIATISVDDLMRQERIETIDLLHSDIQGWELSMLEGAASALRERAIHYLFISTHSEELHRSCTKHLKAADYIVVTSVAPEQSYSVDGLIVAKAPGIQGPDQIEVSLRRSTVRQESAR
jgi:precorrin-6B methylase 2